MVVRLLFVCGAVAGCSFSAQSAGQAGGDASIGGEPVAIGDAARDARAIDAPLDARVWLDAPPVAGSLSATVANVPNGDLNLTSEGSSDWAHWGYGGATGFDRKAGASAISDTTIAGGSKVTITNITETASWTDGTPHQSASATATGVGEFAGSSLTITVPAGVAPRTLRFYCGNKYSSARLDVSLSDNSAGAYTDTQTAGGTALHLVYAIVYNAASDGQTLTVKWTDTADSAMGGFAMVMSATLE